ncbi:hypothetical protein K457DRAFT_124440 [Linnemannia elongata AG-77]|uniref:FAD/NAD(P)-binding domain-containing protein n=1 Tax=Linnemannia elongata AG-77 TaxID=1314771 RepID=A0A197K3N4_9FUNG|nr:hypothetical protein K457DRAFT_124440 [Linnemannia elongata AG-77]
MSTATEAPIHTHLSDDRSFFDTHSAQPTMTSATTASPTTTTPPPRKLRVAVVGSGLAGLTVAHLLSSLHLEDGQGDQGIDVELFEKAHKLGMDAASLSVTCPCQKCALAAGRSDGDPNHEHVEGRMDVPMRSFFAEYYPNLVRLYRAIGVKFHDADNTLACFDVTFDTQSEEFSPSTKYRPSRNHRNVNVESPYLSSRSYKVSSDHTITLPDLPSLSVLNPYPFGRRLLGYYRIARDYVRMLAVSKEFMTQGRMMDIGKDPSEWGNGRQVSLREFLVNGQYSHDFSAFFVPLFACVCTCSFERMMEFPACVVLEYVARCMPFGRMQFVSSGVREVTENLSKNISTIHYNTMVEKIIEAQDAEEANEKGPIVLIDSFGVRRSFDHVIFATQANQAAATLAGQRASKPLPKPFVTSREAGDVESNYGRREEHDLADPETPQDVKVDALASDHPFYAQMKTLAKFPYERTQVVCHTDTSFLPKDPASWRLLNIAKATNADILATPFDEVTAELAKTKRRASTDTLVSNGDDSGLRKRNTGAGDANSTTSSGASSPTTLNNSGSSTPVSTASQSYNSAMATHIMNNTASSLGSTTKFLQTTNPIFQPKPETVISSAWFERAVVNPESMKAVDELSQQMDEQAERLLAGQQPGNNTSTSVSDRVWFVGSYAYPGIPLLEGCVVSAVQVMERIISCSPAHRLNAAVNAPEGSFLRRDAPMRERRRRRKEEQDLMAKLGGQDLEEQLLDQSPSGVYFRTAWKDTLEDEQIWEQQEKARLEKEKATAVGGEVSEKKGHFLSAVGLWTSNVYVEVAWMLLLYLLAIFQWWMVFLIESVGFDGSRWAMA